MPLIKNIHLLDDISPQDKDKMEHAALEHARYNNTSFKIVENKPKSVTMQIAQGKNAASVYHDQKRLIAIVHETFDRFFKGKKIHVQPIPFIESPANIVDAKWINKKMLDLSIRLKDIAAETGLDYPNLSTYMNGEKELPQVMKALFYFYFQSKANAKD